jgi:phospholipid/cholesterol/gamma-HCH transport system permease protein
MASEAGMPPHHPELNFDHPADGSLLIKFTGSWTLKDNMPTADIVLQQLAGNATIRQIGFDGREISNWDTGLLIFLVKLQEQCREGGIALDPQGLPGGVHKLLKLAAAVPAQEDAARHGEAPSLLARIGTATLEFGRGVPEMLQFTGETTIAFSRLLRGKAQFRRADLLLFIQEAGPQALPIVSLISFLSGMIVAYMGAIQLAQFGAQIYIANLVGIGMSREMGAMMVGVIMAGRTGAAFAAQLGTMQVNEEIDAFRTLGIQPMEFLVLPRMLALILVMPLLTLYSDLVGILAGLFVANASFDVGSFEYYHQTIASLHLRDVAVGLVKGTVYGALIALAGCLRGMQCGRSASAVGTATTSAVVTSIVFMVISSSLLTILFQQLGV